MAGAFIVSAPPASKLATPKGYYFILLSPSRARQDAAIISRLRCLRCLERISAAIERATPASRATCRTAISVKAVLCY